MPAAVDRVLRRLRGGVDLVVLDPPRAGAGRAVMAEMARRGPRAVAYVSCDPATLARRWRRRPGGDTASVRCAPSTCSP